MTTYNVNLNCRGRGFQGEEVLSRDTLVNIRLSQNPGSSMVSVMPTDCPHNTGGHGQRCKAAHPDQDKVGDGIACPYSFDYPYAREREGWEPPADLVTALRRSQINLLQG